MSRNRLNIFAFVSILAGILAVPAAFAQGGNAPRAPVAHPATNPNCSLAPTPGVPFSTVVGTSWVFHWKGIAGELAAVGNMSFISIPDPNSQSGAAGFLNVIETRNIIGQIYRFLNYNGRFLIFPDCTGGTLMFNSGAAGSQEFDFYFRKRNGDPFGSLWMVDIDPTGNIGTVRASRGARLNEVNTGGDPLIEVGEAEKQGPS